MDADPFQTHRGHGVTRTNRVVPDTWRLYGQVRRKPIGDSRLLAILAILKPILPFGICRAKIIANQLGMPKLTITRQTCLIYRSTWLENLLSCWTRFRKPHNFGVYWQ